MTTEVKTGMDAVFAVIKPAALARELNIARSAMTFWKKTGQVPKNRAAAVARITGLPLEVVCPDLFDDEAAA